MDFVAGLHATSNTMLADYYETWSNCIHKALLAVTGSVLRCKVDYPSHTSEPSSNMPNITPLALFALLLFPGLSLGQPRHNNDLAGDVAALRSRASMSARAANARSTVARDLLVEVRKDSATECAEQGYECLQPQPRFVSVILERF